jgi:hypothetical protein
MTPEGESGKRRYGRWAGNPNGKPEDVTLCAESVPGGAFGIGRQCYRKRGHGAHGEYCRQHAKKYEGGDR